MVFVLASLEFAEAYRTLYSYPCLLRSSANMYSISLGPYFPCLLFLNSARLHLFLRCSAFPHHAA